MPCNDSVPFCGEGTSNSAAIVNAHPSPSSSSNANAETDSSVDERRVSICALENGTSQPEQNGESKNISRQRTASSRSICSSHQFQSLINVLPGEDLSKDSENFVNLETCQLYLTRYRIIIISHNQNAVCAIPLTSVDLLEAKDIVVLQIICKDGRIIKLKAENSETACAWYKRLIQKTCIARELKSIFAFQFYSQTVKKAPVWLRREHNKHCSALDQVKNEFIRLRLSESNWRITEMNDKFELCPTYPKYLIVPKSVEDEELKQMSFGRYHRRFPTLVWRNRRNGAILLRSSQPSIGLSIGFFGMSNDKDVLLYEKTRMAVSIENAKFLIVDARSYTAAWANRAKGGGFEAADTYTNSEVLFMGLQNIHNIRYSFHQLRLLLNSGSDPSLYLQTLQSSLWLQNICQLFTATERCLNALSEGVSVLVHCSDGWDRTTQIVSLCMLIADPFYRTFEGFELLVQRQWVEFGHKFADRGGVLNSDDNEKSPVFLQFLDCVYQIWEKNPNQFEFNRRYLMKLVQHTFSGLFGTFLFNSIREAVENHCDPNEWDEQKLQCYQVWSYLGKHNSEFSNPAFNAKNARTMLRYPKVIPELLLWRDAYCCTADQLLINNPGDSLHHNNGTGSTQDISADKASSTLSRSQSAASLTSLHDQTSNNNNPAHNINFAIPNGSGHFTAPKMNETNSIGSSISLNWQGQHKLDRDGLSYVPLQVEDYVQRRIADLEKQLGHQQLQQQSNKIQQCAVINNASTANGKMNGAGGEAAPNQRRRNESVESSFEIVNSDCCSRLKHNSSSSLTSGVIPSSFSSNCTTLSDGICTRNGILQEGVEPIDANGIEMHPPLSNG